MYRSGDVLAHFKGVCVFLEIAVQHASRQKEETIYCPYIVCKNHAVHSAITTAGSTLPGYHRRAQELRRPPDRFAVNSLSLSLSHSLYKFCFPVF
jgi:hypothetical protein